MCLMIILKSIKKQGFTPSLENSVLEKPHGCLSDLPQPFKAQIQVPFGNTFVFHN